jgi:hypothetical protein
MRGDLIQKSHVGQGLGSDRPLCQHSHVIVVQEWCRQMVCSDAGFLEKVLVTIRRMIPSFS